jgi:hypothetical protein
MDRYDEKVFLDLLQEYKSDDTKKARRNLSVIAFSIIAAFFLRIKLTDIKALGIDLSQAPELRVYLVGLVLLIYWVSMLYFSWTQDKEIQKERGVALKKMVDSANKRMSEIEEMRKENPNRMVSDMGDIKDVIRRYKEQKVRTERAAEFGGIIRHLETKVPFGLALASGVILLGGILRAL